MQIECQFWGSRHAYRHPLLNSERQAVRKTTIVAFLLSFFPLFATAPLLAAPLRAGAAKVDITHPDHPTRPGDKLYAKALVLSDDATTTVLITVDAVSLGEIGYIKKEYLPNVRAALAKELKIKPENVQV